MGTKRRLDVWDKEKEVIEIYLKDKKSLPELTEIFNCSRNLIKRILRSNSIKIRPQRYYILGKPSWNKNKKLPQLSGENHFAYGKTYEEIYGEKKARETKKKMRGKKIGIPQFHNRRKDIDRRKEEILNLYCNKLYTQEKIAKLMNCDLDVIKRILTKENIEIRPLNFYTKGKESPLRLKLPEKEIIKLYEETLSGNAIAKKFNCTFSVIYNLLKRNGIKVKKPGFYNKGKPSWNKGLTKETDERVRKYGEKLIGFKPSEESIEKNRIAHKKLMADPEYKERVITKSMRAMKIKPNKPETIMINLIKKNNLPFNYTGDAKIWFRGKNHIFNPDFLSKNPKHIIEVFGDYWHNLPGAREKDKERLKTYVKYGYKTLIVWDYELKHPNQVLSKIKEFIK